MNPSSTGPALAFPRLPAASVLAAGSTGGIFLWLGVLLVVAVVGGLGIMWLRRRLLSKETSTPGGFDLHSLRELRDRGEVSPEEYERLKALVIGQSRAGPDGSSASNDPAHKLRPKQGPP